MSRDFKLLICSLNWTSPDTNRHDTGLGVGLSLAGGLVTFFYFLSHLEEEEKAGCFAIIVLHMYSYYTCSVAFPHGAVGWSAVSDCGIS